MNAILANSMLGSEAKSAQHDVVMQEKRQSQNGKAALFPTGNNNKAVKKQQQQQYFASPQQQQMRPLALKESLLKNDNKKKAKDFLNGPSAAATLKECDPNVGLLSCGHGKYCAESSDSSQGGYCTPENGAVTKLPGRRRQQVVGRLSIIELADLFCNRPEETGLTVDCNCTVDFASFSGDFSCYFGPDCTDITTGCEDETFPLCSTEQLDATMEGPASYSYTSCYTQTLPGTSERFSYCTDFSYSEGAGPACDIQVEGVTCNSCGIDVGGGDQYGENCEVFDCSNTVASYSGDRCGAFSDPALRAVALVEYLYESRWPCADGCNLCGEEGRMTNGSNNFTYPAQFLETDVTIQCYDLQYDALTGGLSQGDYCTNLPPLVNDICGCVAPPTSAPDTPTDAPVNTPTDTPPTGTPPGGATNLSRSGFGVTVIAGVAVVLSALWGT
ncbi:MAG: hypothetical protein SGILL_006861 [Bacillariaceae sp.]